MVRKILDLLAHSTWKDFKHYDFVHCTQTPDFFNLHISHSKENLFGLMFSIPLS